VGQTSGGNVEGAKEVYASAMTRGRIIGLYRSRISGMKRLFPVVINLLRSFYRQN
jgi:hypothetical protein